MSPAPEHCSSSFATARWRQIAITICRRLWVASRSEPRYDAQHGLGAVTDTTLLLYFSSCTLLHKTSQYPIGATNIAQQQTYLYDNERQIFVTTTICQITTIHILHNHNPQWTENDSFLFVVISLKLTCFYQTLTTNHMVYIPDCRCMLSE